LKPFAVRPGGRLNRGKEPWNTPFVANPFIPNKDEMEAEAGSVIAISYAQIFFFSLCYFLNSSWNAEYEYEYS
jgi:hypothetical protein